MQVNSKRMLFLDLDAKEFTFYFPQLHPPRFANSLQYSQNIHVNELIMVRYIFDFTSMTHGGGMGWGEGGALYYLSPWTEAI